MPLYINQDVIIVNNQFEKSLFIYDRKNRIKSIINEDMFEILDFIYQHEGITLNELSKSYSDLDDIINQLLDLNILKKTKQKRCNNIINDEKMNLCIEIMNNYYYGVKGIDNFFNI